MNHARALVVCLGLGLVGCPGAQAQRTVSEVDASGSATSIEPDTDYLGASRRERLGYRRRIQNEIDDVDRQLRRLNVEVEPRGGHAVIPEHVDDQRVRRLLNRRDLLEADLRAAETATWSEWEATRARIDRDLTRDRI